MEALFSLFRSDWALVILALVVLAWFAAHRAGTPSRH